MTIRTPAATVVRRLITGEVALALKFACSGCGATVVVRFLEPGEVSECKACGHREAVPVDAVAASEEEARDAAFQVRTSPRGPGVTDASGEDEPAGYLASRPKRLIGFLLDHFLFGIPVAIMLVPAVGRIAVGPFKDHGWMEALPFTPEYWLAILFIFGLAIVQAVLLVERGQTIGKVVVGTRIVTLDDRHPAWWRLIILRPLIILVATMRPDIMWPDQVWSAVMRHMLSGVFIVNALSVFGPERRALHDRLAGTHVIDLLRLRKSPDGDGIMQGWKQKKEKEGVWERREDGIGSTP